MDYKIVVGINAVDLEKNVKSYLLLGWQLQGGVSAMNGGLFQAMTKTN
ncbi:DUF1737 domain-containing protein [Chryseobacterium gwangjuense]|nr:DUF1737 domain-containing protein [Chryseobacterium gwangjuense]MCE3075533.1 DUF1737 domain-containing protein [Chryseobacterium gwangjuense]